jgi:hypothetical protein
VPDDLTGDGAAAPARAVSALLFLTAGMTTLDAYSTLNSSPWTAENFGGDAAKVASLKEYVQHAVVFSMGYAAASAYLARNWFPILGAGVANAYLWWLYDRAAGRGESAGSVGWQSQR